MAVEVFSIGAFLFVPKAAPDDPTKWRANVERQLNSLASITDIEIDLDFGQWTSTVASPSETTEFDDDRTSEIVQPINGSIAFKVGIPKRIQHDILPDFECLSEQFLVRTMYEYHGPVTFVKPIGSGDTDVWPSRSVMVVREFLRREFRVAGEIDLQITGPSPFHCEFLAMDGSGARVTNPEEVGKPLPPTIAGFEFVRIPQKGYDVVFFTWRPARDGDTRPPIEKLWKEIADEFSLFYELIRQARDHSIRAREITEEARTLADYHQGRGVRAVLWRVFRSGPAARAVLLQSIQLETEEALRRSGNERRLSDSRSSVYGYLFEDKMKEAESRSSTVELKAAREISTALEGGRTKEFEIAIVSASTLLGAVAGAVASIIAS